MRNYFNCAFLFALASLITSFYVAIKTNGDFFSTVSSEQMITYGALNGANLKVDEAWRLFVSQLIHHKQLHMIFNIILVCILGTSIERQIGGVRFSLLYWASGIVGMMVSVLAYPNYTSSGASQALMALFAAIILLRLKKFKIQNLIFYIAILGLLVQLGLDVYVNRYPKAGHVAGFIVGGIIAKTIISQLKKGEG